MECLVSDDEERVWRTYLFRQGHRSAAKHRLRKAVSVDVTHWHSKFSDSQWPPLPEFENRYRTNRDDQRSDVPNEGGACPEL
jgi:hypothetical protein